MADSIEADRIVHIFGKVSVRVGENPIILVEKIDFIDEKKSETNEKQTINTKPETMGNVKKVYLRFDLTNKKLVDEVGQILSGYPGESPAFVQYNNKLYNLNVEVEASMALVAELSGVVGENNVKVI